VAESGPPGTWLPLGAGPARSLRAPAERQDSVKRMPTLFRAGFKTQVRHIRVRASSEECDRATTDAAVDSLHQLLEPWDTGTRVI
jgi:hypothetical protein